MAEPTNEQLARFALVQTHGPQKFSPFTVQIVESLIAKSPTLRRIWLERHRDLQEQLDQARV